MLEGFLLDLLFARRTLGAVKALKRPLHLFQRIFADGRGHILAHGHQRELALFFADFGNDAFLEGDELLDLFVRVENGLKHLLFADFLGAGLDHHDGVLGAGNRQVQVALFALLHGGVEHEFIVDQTHHHRARGAGEGDFGNAQRNGGADHRGDFGGAVVIVGKHGRHDADVVAHSLGEERAQRAVDQAGGQNGLLGGTAFALDEAAGDLTHGVLLFLEIHAQREEVDAGAGRIGDGGADQHDGVAVADQNGSGSLLGIAAELEGQLAARKLCFIDLVFHVFRGSFLSSPAKAGRSVRGVCPALLPHQSVRQTPRDHAARFFLLKNSFAGSSFVFFSL